MAKRSSKVQPHKQYGEQSPTGFSVEQYENPWPEGEEIRKLQKVYPEAPKEIFDYTKREQQFRHEQTERRGKRLYRLNAKELNMLYYGMSLAFLILNGRGLCFLRVDNE